MIFPRRDNARRRRKAAATFAVAGVLLAIILALNAWAPQALAPAVRAVARPFQEAEINASGLRGFIGLLKYKWALEDENARLKRELESHEAIEVERDGFKARVAELEALFGRAADPSSFTLARVLAKPGLSLYDTVVIDAGEREGIAAGDLVLADESVVLGIVASVDARTATVRLFSSPEEKTDVFVGESGLPAVAIGKGGGTFELKLPRNAGILEGDIVTLASTTGKVFGKVTYVSESASDAFEKALFKSPVDASHVTMVLVEKRKSR